MLAFKSKGLNSTKANFPTTCKYSNYIRKPFTTKFSHYGRTRGFNTINTKTHRKTESVDSFTYLPYSRSISIRSTYLPSPKSSKCAFSRGFPTTILNALFSNQNCYTVTSWEYVNSDIHLTYLLSSFFVSGASSHRFLQLPACHLRPFAD